MPEAIDNIEHKPLIIPYGFARKHGVLLDASNPDVKLLFKETISLDVLSEVQRCFGIQNEIEIIDTKQFEQKLQQQTESNASESIQVADGIDQDIDIMQLASELEEPDDLLENANDAPIVKLLNALITEAVREDASDIHIEQYENRLRVRFRVDGALKQVLEPNQKVAPLIVSRIKVMAKLDIAEKRLPQDGRISVKVGGRAIDMRVSTIPSGDQMERVVLRLLNKDEDRLSLDYLGMPLDTKQRIEAVISRPHGILLVTGPTGSGKTTSLYAMLSRLNDHERNIMTVENPVEYYIDGINQTQVNNQIGMDFASGLRSILRQDPDVIMVGEIRDAETARIAVQASLTGHVVFSTLHTNTAVGAITRLRDMGVEPFLLASSLNGVLAQRLVRKLCASCKRPKQADHSEQELLNQMQSTVMYEAEGCSECGHSGYRGRIGIYEFFEMDEPLSSLIHDNSSEADMLSHIRKRSQDLFSSGVELVLSGETSLDEVIRVTGIKTDQG